MQLFVGVAVPDLGDGGLSDVSRHYGPRVVAAAEHRVAIPDDIHAPERDRAEPRRRVAGREAVALDRGVGLISHPDALEADAAAFPEGALGVNRIGGAIGNGCA